METNNIPTHVAVIMDGNGRWAEKLGLPREEGHREGVLAVKRIVESAIKAEVRYLTLYTFSKENWSRPQAEITAIMDLLKDYLLSEFDNLLRNNIRIQFIGNMSDLSEDIQKIIYDVSSMTSDNNNLCLTLAISYSGKQDIIEATKKIASEFYYCLVDLNEITTNNFKNYLSTADIPDPDLLIRTSGEYRLSNFLLWETAYTELYFVDKLWPAFTEADFQEAITEFQKRKRKFGALI